MKKALLAVLILSGLLSAGCSQIASTVFAFRGVSETVKPAMDIAQKTGEKALAASRKSAIPKEYYLGRGLPPGSCRNIP